MSPSSHEAAVFLFYYSRFGSEVNNPIHKFIRPAVSMSTSFPDNTSMGVLVSQVSWRMYALGPMAYGGGEGQGSAEAEIHELLPPCLPASRVRCFSRLPFSAWGKDYIDFASQVKTFSS